MTPAPCPFCGAGLRQTRNGWEHPTVKQNQSRPCVLSGNHFGDAYLEWVGWQPAKTREVHYTMLPTGYPMFNIHGEGAPADIDFINACFSYMVGQLNAKTDTTGT